jgi:hypothetical protein
MYLRRIAVSNKLLLHAFPFLKQVCITVESSVKTGID